MIAQWDGKRPCVTCGGRILAGQEITGSRGQWMHVECSPSGASSSAPTPVAAVASTNGNGHQMRDPGAPANGKQLGFIKALLDEREVTKGEAGTLIDYLKAKPRRSAQANDLASRLAA